MVSDIICGLQCCKRLTLEGVFDPDAPKDLDQLECLEELSLQSTIIKDLSDSICGAPVVLVIIASGPFDVTFAKKNRRFILFHGSDRLSVLIKLEEYEVTSLPIISDII
ncbi:leucine-rich repeat domain, L domain-like protein [Artemisia annua]|uniref:Leucine-rich repeat domain, L domain-like protein n=1 Tax=Artemisia annua TaxID=35608 RepID=A0A2U1KCA0_ARTAN|nr:leucine-rich repeat domain, L domain-like protein [Artemisia annua]